jgi:hypothetical protein
MLKIFFLTLIVLATIAGGSQVLISNMLNATMIVENNATVLGTMNRLKQSVLYSNGLYYLPYGLESTDYHALPVSFFGLRKSAQGRDLIYCPYASSTIVTPSDTVSMANGDIYEVTLSDAFSPDGSDYVTESTPPPVAGIAAILILPQRSADLPSCNDVGVNAEGEFLLTGNSADKGMVYVLTLSEIAFIYRGGVNAFIQASDAAAKFTETLQKIASTPSENAVITLEAGATFAINNSFMFSSTDGSLPRSIIIKSSRTGVNAQISSSGVQTLAFEGTSVTFKDVVLGTNVQLSADESSATFVNFGATSLSANDSNIILDNTSFGRNGNISRAVYMSNSRVVQKGRLWLLGTANPMMELINSDWVARDDISIDYNGGSADPVVKINLENSVFDLRGVSLSSSGSASQGALFGVSPSSTLNLLNMTWSNSGNLRTGFDVLGQMHISGSALHGSRNVNTVIFARGGSDIRIVGSTIGQTSERPAIGIQSNYAARISGPYRQSPPGASPLIGTPVLVAADNCTDGWKFVDDVYDGQSVSFFVDDVYVKAVDPFYGSVVSNIDPNNTNANDVSASLVLNCL